MYRISYKIKPDTKYFNIETHAKSVAHCIQAEENIP